MTMDVVPRLCYLFYDMAMSVSVVVSAPSMPFHIQDAIPGELTLTNISLKLDFVFAAIKRYASYTIWKLRSK